MSDEELMLKVKEDGDQRAFELLVQRYKKPLLNFVYRFVGDQEEAFDISQEVFLRLWANAASYLPISKFATFLYTIAKNLCLNFLAREKGEPKMQSLGETSDREHDLRDQLVDPSSSPEQELLSMEIEDRIREAVGKLSPEHRLIFILTEYQGLSYQEVADIAQCPVGTVASRKNTAVKLLRRYLAPLEMDK